jgi:hypothetical protein
MAIKIIDPKGFHKYMDHIDATDDKIEELRSQLKSLEEYRKDLFARKEECVIHYLDEPTYSHSMEMIDKFITDTGFDGLWDFDKFWDRYAYFDDAKGWDCGIYNLNVVYYAEVEMRYKDLKREGKL